MNDTVVVYMQAYNAERTLRRALDSMLNQTYRDWILYLVDNGSTDSTGNIADKYAEMDSRIICKHVFPNNFLYFHSFIATYLRNPLGCYFAWLDSDDEYDPNFLNHMSQFAQENKLDVAACGNYFIDGISGHCLSVRTSKRNIILESKQDFDKYFPIYHQFIRTMWAKLFSTSILQKGIFLPNRSISYGSDTMFLLESVRLSQRIGILSEPLHKYYISNKSVSYKLDSKRITSDQILFNETYKFGRT